MADEKSRADRIREHFSEASAADPSVAVLVEEAARMSERLDHIDSIITGKTEWIQLMHFRTQSGDVQEVTVTLDGVLAEGRQQANALKSLMQQLGAGRADVVKKESARDPLDDLAARRTARGGATSRLGGAGGRAS